MILPATYSLCLAREFPRVLEDPSCEIRRSRNTCASSGAQGTLSIVFISRHLDSHHLTIIAQFTLTAHSSCHPTSTPLIHLRSTMSSKQVTWDRRNDRTAKNKARATATRYKNRNKRAEELEALQLVAQFDADQAAKLEGECQEAARA